MAAEAFLDWVDKQPDWARDALRRHALAPQFELGEADAKAIIDHIRHMAGFTVDAAPKAYPITAAHIGKSEAIGSRTLLCSIGPVKHLNRLADDQTMSFALDGVTLIYGDNGSGKSCYCRIAKKLCRCLMPEDLLGNVFVEESKERVEVVVRYRPDDAKDVICETWVDDTAPPQPIAKISVFDAQNARLSL